MYRILTNRNFWVCLKNCDLCYNYAVDLTALEYRCDVGSLIRLVPYYLVILVSFVIIIIIIIIIIALPIYITHRYIICAIYCVYYENANCVLSLYINTFREKLTNNFCATIFRRKMMDPHLKTPGLPSLKYAEP